MSKGSVSDGAPGEGNLGHAGGKSGASPGDAPVRLDAEERELIRSLILADPDLILGDDMVMRALIGASGRGARNIVDLRDKLVERLEQRLRKLMHANRSVIAAAYENVAGTRQLHRAILALLDAPDHATFLARLVAEVPRTVGVDEGRLCLEAEVTEIVPAEDLAPGLGGRVLLFPPGTVAQYMALGSEGDETAGVVLRPVTEAAELVFGPLSTVRSEALVRLAFGDRIGLFAFGDSEPDRFTPDQGTDLLSFFGGVVERLLARHLRGPGGGT